jgi:DNA-binding phage protein
MRDYLKLYHEKLENDAEATLTESLEQVDEAIIMTAIAGAIAAGVIFRVIDGIRGSKPKVRHYIKGLITWAFSDYESGTLSVNDIRRAAYATMKEDKEIRDEFGPSSSKILSKKLLKGLKKGSKEFSELLGNAIGRIAKRAQMSKEDLDKTISTVDLS